MSVSLQTWIPPSMPGQVAPLGGIAPGAMGGGGAQPPANPAPAPSPAPAPAPSPSPGSTSGASPAQQREVWNNNVVPDIAAAMNRRSFQLRTLFGCGRPPPQHTNGRQMCCTYHLRGRCSNTCSRAYSHGTLSTAEQETLRTFVNERIVTPNIGREGSGSGAAGANDS